MADLSALRASLQAAEDALTQALYQRSLSAGTATQAALAQAQQAARASKNALNAALAASIKPGTDSAATLQGNLPVALFPVRLETRFARGGSIIAGGPRVSATAASLARSASPAAIGVSPTRPPSATIVANPPSAAPAGVLQIRVYPDEILAKTHEPELTDDEWQAGRTYWGAGDALASWTALLTRFSPQRAAWIVSQTQTSNRPPARAASWTRPATAVLPDNLAAFAYRGGTLVASVVGSAVVEPLTLTVSPVLDVAPRVAIPGSTLQVDADLLWTLDFASAKAAGMGLELPVSALDWTQGFDLLLVVGCKGTFSVAEAGAQIQLVLDGHHYTRGVGLVAGGTPTSNLPDASSGFPAADPAGALSFAVERGTPASGDGVLLANAFGVSPAVLAHVDGTSLGADSAAQSMLTALWPATLGYHLEQMMAPADANLAAPFNATSVAAAYDYTRANVRPGGPLPAFRVGSVPYGIVPVTSLARMAGMAPAPLTSALAALRANLLSMSDQAPRVDPGSSDPDGDLVNVLRLDASATAFLVQVLIGTQLQSQLALLPGLNGAATTSAYGLQGGIADALLRSLGLPSTNTPRIAQSSFGTPEPFSGVLVSSAADRQSPLPSGANYIQWILEQLGSDGAALTSDTLPAPYERTLLYQLLRHAVLVEKGRTARPNLREIEVIGLATTITAAPGPEASSAAPAAGTTLSSATATLGPGAIAVPPPPPPVSHMADVTAALQVLAGLPIEELERLFTETLALCSYRFDAWTTSLATARLKALRGTDATGKPGAQGSHFGVYGWVQSLRPATDPFDPGPGGFIHAPSPNHAQTAAILRNGFLARGEAGTHLYAIDLSSARVRTGLDVLARIRDGEALSEILGTEIETRLRADTTLATTFLEPLRISYPTPSSPILDGLAAVLAWRASPTSPHFPAAVLFEVSQLLDAAADLLTAESVYQMVAGNPGGATAGLDALGQGTRPPEPQVAHAPVAGTAISHRIAVVVDDTPAPGWNAAATPRSSACRYIDSWLGLLFGDPQRVKCRVNASNGPQVVSLGQLGLRPIDVVALAGEPLDGTSELNQRIRQQAGDPLATITYAADSAWGPEAITFPALLEIARAADNLISLARPLVASDFATVADEISDSADPDVATRAAAALNALVALDLSNPATQELQLRRSALFGFGGAFVADNINSADLAATAQRVDTERQTRIHAAQAAVAPADVMRCVFGRKLPLLGDFTVPATVPTALSGPAGLSASDVSKWMHKAARVRPGLDRWRRTRLVSDALGAPAAAWDVVQLPYSATAPWCALPFSSGAGPASGTVSIALHRPWKTLPTASWAGLLLEEWSELIPAPVQQTGLAFHYPSPRAEAPQAVLIAVPPVDSTEWSTQVLADIVRETFELARIRLVTPQALGTLSLVLPATSLSVNSAGDALSTNLWHSVVAPIQVAPAARS